MPRFGKPPGLRQHAASNNGTCSLTCDASVNVWTHWETLKCVRRVVSADGVSESGSAKPTGSDALPPSRFAPHVSCVDGLSVPLRAPLVELCSLTEPMCPFPCALMPTAITACCVRL